MMQSSMPAQIPQGLAGAIALLKLKQEVNPVAPGPMGAPRPSVVGAMIQEAEQQMGSPPMGNMMPDGGMYGAAENLRNALPTMEQNAQNAQLEQIAQRLQQMDPTETGIAPMAPPMQMAEGGIIGYNGAGRQGQFVAPPVPKAPTLEDVMRAATQMSAHIPTASRTEPLLAEYEQMRKNLPDYGQQEVEAIEKRRARRESESGKEGLMAFLAGLGQGGLGGAGSSAMAFNRALREADEADDKAIITARKAQDAMRRGDLENAFKMANASDKFSMDAAQLKTNAITAAERMEQGRYSTQAQLYGAQEKLGIEALKAQTDARRAEIMSSQTREASTQANQQRLMTLLTNAEVRKQQLVRDITNKYMDRNKMIYMAANLPNPTPEALQKRREADLELAEIIRQQTADLDKIMVQTAQQIPGFGDLYKPTPTGAKDSQGVDLNNPLLRK